MLRRDPLVRTDVCEERIVSIIRVTVFLPSMLLLLVTVNVVPSSPILVALMMQAICSSEMPVFSRATHRHIPEDGIPQESIVFRETTRCSEVAFRGNISQYSGLKNNTWSELV
jgi:hypothetical protein